MLAAQIDKEGANIDRVKQELTDAGVLIEEWGGQTPAVPVRSLKSIPKQHSPAGSRVLAQWHVKEGPEIGA